MEESFEQDKTKISSKFCSLELLKRPEILGLELYWAFNFELGQAWASRIRAFWAYCEAGNLKKNNLRANFEPGQEVERLISSS